MARSSQKLTTFQIEEAEKKRDERMVELRNMAKEVVNPTPSPAPPPQRINVQKVFVAPTIPNQDEVDRILSQSIVVEDKLRDVARHDINPQKSSNHVSRNSRFKSLSLQLPQRILSSNEYDFFIVRGCVGNPYTDGNVAFYIWNHILRVQKKNGSAYFPELFDSMMKSGVHRLSKGIYNFITRFRDVVEILCHESIAVLIYDDQLGTLKIVDKHAI